MVADHKLPGVNSKQWPHLMTSNVLRELPALEAGYSGTRNLRRAKFAAISFSKPRLVNLFSRQTLPAGRCIQISARGVARGRSPDLKRTAQVFAACNIEHSALCLVIGLNPLRRITLIADALNRARKSRRSPFSLRERSFRTAAKPRSRAVGSLGYGIYAAGFH